MLLAHEGGWDEALFVIVPLAIVFALIWMVKRRAAKAGTPTRSDSTRSDSTRSDSLDPSAE
jgi:cyanate permease